MKDGYPLPNDRPRDLSGAVNSLQPTKEYGNTLEEYEEKIFRAAISFNVVRIKSHNNSEIMTVNTYPKALYLAHQEDRALIYCVTEAGRSLCIPKKDYGRYALTWMQMHRQS